MWVLASTHTARFRAAVGDAHLRAFSERPDYLVPATRGLAAGGHWPVDFGPELSRTNRALKVWSHLTEHGTTKLGKAIGANVAHASHLAKLVDAEPALERLAPADLNIVVFRYVGAGGATRAARRRRWRRSCPAGGSRTSASRT